MAKLYPPIIEEIVPAFSGTGGLSVPYTLNRAVGINEVMGFALIVKSSVTNKEIYTVRNSSGLSAATGLTTASLGGTVTFDIDTSKFLTGGWYKIQIAFIDANNEVGYFSNAVLVKYIGENKPALTVNYSSNSSESFIGTYRCDDVTEKMNSYRFILYDNKGELVEDSGEQLHDSTADTGLTQRQTWNLKRVLDNGANYSITFEVTTINNLVLKTSEIITAHKDPEGYAPYGIQLDAKVNNEEGYVELTIQSNVVNDTRELIYGKFEIFKTSSKDDFKSKYRVAYFELQNQDLYEKKFKDFTVESGYSYIYVLQQRNNYGIYSEEIFSNEGEPLEVYYEHIYLFDGDKQLKIAYNPKVQSFKDTILEQKVDTIGSKYPFIFRNNTVKYKEVPISGLISYQLDPENLFMDDNDIWFKKEKSFKGEKTNSSAWKDENWTHNLTDNNIAAERAFRLRVMEWLENGRPKLFKSPTEGNYILRLMNVTLSPVDTLGRMLYSFNATGYEIEDASTYSFADILQMDNSAKYIGYRTMPLWEEFFPPFYYVANKAIVPELNKYEIIGNRGLEWVIGFTLENIKPGTTFDVVVERQLEKATLTLRVGATGVYHFPETLGYHIVSIKLNQPSWDTNDYGFDIINNRGQVTYVYERQAKHNNFNDITKISLTKEISYPLISSWYTDLQLNQQLTSVTGRPLYQLVNSGFQQEAFVEMGFFRVGPKNGDKTIKLLTRSVDYDYEDGTYTLLKNPNNEVIELITEPEEIRDNTGRIIELRHYGCKRSIGDPIYKYDEIYTYTSSIDQNDGATTYNSPNGEIVLEKTKKYYCQLYNDRTLYYTDNNNQQRLDSNRIPNFFDNESIELVNGQYFQGNDVMQWICGTINNSIADDGIITINKIFKKVTTSTGNILIKDVVSGKPYYENPFYVKIYQDPVFKKAERDADSVKTPWNQQTWDDPMLKVIMKKEQNVPLSQLTNNWLYHFLSSKSNSYFKIDSNGNVSIYQDGIMADNLDPLWQDEQPTEFLQNLIYQIFQRSIEKYAITVPFQTLEPVYSNASIDNNFQPLYLPMFPKNVIQEKYYALKNITGDYYKKQENVHLYNLDFELIQVFYDEDLVQTGQNYTFDGGFLTLKDVNEDNGYQYTERIIETQEQKPEGLNKETSGNKQNYYLEQTERYVDKFEYGWNRDNWNNITKANTNTWLSQHYLISLAQLTDNATGNYGLNSNYCDYINYLFDGIFPNTTNRNNIKSIIKNNNIDVFEKVAYLDTAVNGAFQFNKILNSDINISGDSDLENIYINLQAQALKKYNERTTPKPNEIVIVVNEDLSDIVKIDLTNRFSYHLDFDNESWDNVSAIYLGTNVRGFLTFDRKRYAYNAIGEDGVNVKLDFEN